MQAKSTFSFKLLISLPFCAHTNEKSLPVDFEQTPQIADEDPRTAHGVAKASATSPNSALGDKNELWDIRNQL